MKKLDSMLMSLQLCIGQNVNQNNQYQICIFFHKTQFNELLKVIIALKTANSPQSQMGATNVVLLPPPWLQLLELMT